MQFLGGPPGAAVAVFAEVLHHQTHVFEMADARFRVAKPKALGMTAHQLRRSLAQIRRSGCGRRHFAQLTRLGCHEINVRMILALGKESLSRAYRRASLLCHHNFCRILPAAATLS